MNLHTLKQILAQSRHPSAPQLYSEVSNYIDHLVNNDGDPEHVYLVDQYALFILLNETTYDVYGRLRKEYGEADDLLDKYMAQARFYESHCLTDEQLKDAYDAIADLWEYNERDRHHRADGGYWSTLCGLAKSLYTILLELEGDATTLDEKLHGLLVRQEYEELKIITKEDHHD